MIDIYSYQADLLNLVGLLVQVDLMMRKGNLDKNKIPDLPVDPCDPLKPGRP